MRKSQYRILEALDDPDIVTVQTPAVIAYNVDLHNKTVSRELSDLVDRGLVEKVDRGKYRITDDGRAVVTER